MIFPCKFRHWCILAWVAAFTLIQTDIAGATLRFKVDPDRSVITFRVRELGITWVRGKFRPVSGHIILEDDSSRLTEIDIRVRVAGVDTGNMERDRYLKGPEFFHSDAFPWIRFKSSSIDRIDRHQFRIRGDLSFHGITRRIQIEATQTGAQADSKWERRSVFHTVFTVRRSEYGMKPIMGGLGDKVELTVNVAGTHKKLFLTPPVFDDK